MRVVWRVGWGDLAEDTTGFVEEDTFEVHFQGLRVCGFGESFGFGYLAFLDEVVEGLIEVLHTVLDAGFDGCAEFIEAVFLEEFPDGAGIDHDFEGGDDAAFDFADHTLADHGLEGAGELAADGVAFVLFEEVEDTADGLGGVGGMEGGQDEVAGICGAHGGAEAGGVAHFADHDDIGVLAEHVFEPHGEGEGIEADFALFDGALVIVEDIFDGVFERDDVLFEVGVDVLDHGGEGCGFTATCGACDEDDAAFGLGDFLEHGEESEFFESGDVGFDVAHGQAVLAFLLEQVGAEASDTFPVVGEVDFVIFGEALMEVWGDDGIDDGVHPFLGWDRGLHGDQFAVDTEDDGASDFEVYI